MRILILVILLAALLGPLATAHGAPAAPIPLTGQTPSPTALFSPEPSVRLLSMERGSSAAWQNAPTTEYDLRFICPAAPTDDVQPPAGQKVPTACPAYVLDAEDILAQPDLAIDPRDPDQVAFHAMHGGPGLRQPLDDPLPTERSRANIVHQPHTTFQSTDGGSFWEDNRYYAPQGLAAKNDQVYGEDNALELDPKGNMVLASLYSARREKGDEPHFVVYLWNSGRIQEPVEYSKGNVARDVPEGLKADSLDLAWHEQAQEMVVLWRTTGAQGPRVHVEHKGESGQWKAWDQEAVVGPCDALSNAVSVGKRVVFACAQGSDTRVWAINANWTVEDLGTAPLHGLTSLRLASAETLREGGIVIAGATAREGRTNVVIAWGVAGVEWGRPSQHGASLTDAVSHPGAALTEAHLTALVVKGTSGTAHFLLQERFTGASATDTRVFSKTYGVVQTSGRFLGTFGLGYGDPQSRASVPITVSGNSVGGFHDAHDSLVVMRSKIGGERLFVAFGDYGYVRYAEVVEVEPTVPIFPPIAAPLAIPTLAAATSPVLVAAAAGVLSMAAVSRIVLARSKKSVEVQA